MVRPTDGEGCPGNDGVAVTVGGRAGTPRLSAPAQALGRPSEGGVGRSLNVVSQDGTQEARARGQDWIVLWLQGEGAVPGGQTAGPAGTGAQGCKS